MTYLAAAMQTAKAAVALVAAVRVRPSKQATHLLRAHLEFLEDLAFTQDERLEAAALRVLLDMNDAIGLALAQGDAISASTVAPGA